MLTCKFCHVTEQSLALDGKPFDFYSCEECESVMCHNCTETSLKTGIDVCQFCKYNLKYEGRWKG